MPLNSTSCLIGSTGFVGSNLREQNLFQDFYSSANSKEMRGKSYDLAVCCGVSAVKWLANAQPDADLKHVNRLLANLEHLQVEEFILLSTVDVFRTPVGVDEISDPHTGDQDAYGRHRLLVEDFVRSQFRRATVIRLPGLFGNGLKKNVIYDLANNKDLHLIQPASKFQYYDLARLWKDIETVRRLQLPLVHFATEPIETKTIARRFFPSKHIGEQSGAPRYYDMRTQFAPLFGGYDGYLYDSDEVLARLARFLVGKPQRSMTNETVGV